MNEVPSFEWRDRSPGMWLVSGYVLAALAAVGFLCVFVWMAVTAKEHWAFLLLLIPLAVAPVAVLYIAPPLMWKGRAILIDYERGVVEFRRPLTVGLPFAFAMPESRTYQFSDLRFVNTERGTDMLTLDVKVPQAQLRVVARTTAEFEECRRRLKEVCREQRAADTRALRSTNRLAKIQLLVYVGVPLALTCAWGIFRLVMWLTK